MTIGRLPSGRWRAQVWHDGRWIPVASVIGGERSYATKKDAQRAKRKAQTELETAPPGAVTVREFRERWISDALFARASESTMIHNAERTKAFAARYGDLPLGHVGDLVVAEWLAGGKRNATIPALRAMFNDAASAKAGRLIARNPFAGLGVERTRGNRDRQPPTEEEAWTLIRHARDLAPPSFAAYLEVACFTALRPGELDALRWSAVDLDHDEIHVREQWNATSRRFTQPKHRHVHTVTLTPNARDALLRDARESEWCFTTLRGTHYTPSARTHHWNRVRAAAGLSHVSLYLATRHYFGWYAVNVLDLDTAIVAEQLGHRDGGLLVEQLYGHPDKRLRREKVRQAFARKAEVRPLRVVDRSA